MIHKKNLKKKEYGKPAGIQVKPVMLVDISHAGLCSQGKCQPEALCHGVDFTVVRCGHCIARMPMVYTVNLRGPTLPRNNFKCV